jgi:hypothetical protein
MENTLTLDSWLGLRNLIVLLIAGYWLLRLVEFLVKKIILTNRGNKKILNILNKIILLYQPISLLLVLLGFISINYVVHSIFLVFIGAISYYYIKNYVGGVLYKINSILDKGVSVTINNITGEIKKFSPFGIIVNTEKGDNFISYSKLDKSGYTINSKNDTLLRQTLYLKTPNSKADLLDMFFDNPIFNFKDAPIVSEISGSENYKLQYTLEKGISSENLIAFLKEQSIETSLTNNTQE